MALQVDCDQTLIGIPLANTYARISHYQGNKTHLYIYVDHFSSEDARHNNFNPVLQRSFSALTNECSGSMADMYNWLKQQPEYQNAIDC